MFLQKHFINQFNETVEEYVLDIDAKIMQRDCIPIILDTIHKTGVEISQYSLFYSDGDCDHHIASANPRDIAGIFWNEDWYIDQLNIQCKLDRLGFWLYIVIASNCISIAYPHDKARPDAVVTLLSEIENVLSAK